MEKINVLENTYFLYYNNNKIIICITRNSKNVFLKNVN